MKKLQSRVKARPNCRKKHPGNYRGRKRGRKPGRLNRRYIPQEQSSGDTKVELLTRSRGLLYKSRDKWSNSQTERAAILFDLHPKIKEGYDLINALRSVFKNKTSDRVPARVKLHERHAKVTACNPREVRAARDTIKSREEEIPNCFVHRSTNASAESLNARMKGFGAQLHGVTDLPFFIFRLGRIFG